MRFSKTVVVLCGALLGGGANAALQGRDLDGSVANGFEAYYDTVLDITWLADWRYPITLGVDADGKMGWVDASAWAQAQDVHGVSGWRLPKIVSGSCLAWNCTNGEIGHLWYTTLGNIASRAPRDTGPFVNMPTSNAFWYTTPASGTEAYGFALSNGFQAEYAKGSQLGIALVRDGDVAAIPEPRSWALLLAGLGLILGASRRRV